MRGRYLHKVVNSGCLPQSILLRDLVPLVETTSHRESAVKEAIVIVRRLPQFKGGLGRLVEVRIRGC